MISFANEKVFIGFEENEFDDPEDDDELEIEEKLDFEPDWLSKISFLFISKKILRF